MLPEWIRLRAGVCVGLNVYIDRMTQTSSITVESCGSKLADFDAALAVLLELAGAGQQTAGLPLCAQIH